MCPRHVKFTIRLLLLMVGVGVVSGNLDSTDKYLPKEVEARPWTDQNALKDRVPFHFMELTHRDIQNNCDGQCFYHSGETGRDTCTALKNKDCGLIASIARHGHKQCGNIGSAIGRTLNNTICSEDQLYTITLIRRNLYQSCKSIWDFSKKMPCVPTEFVAIAFYEDSDSALNDRDKWYTCIKGESTVTLWRNARTQAIQIKGTKPYQNSASGVIASYMTYGELVEDSSFACQFIISAGSLNIDQNADVKFPLEDNYTGNPIKVKLAQGRVERNVVPEDEIPQSIKDEYALVPGADKIEKDRDTLKQEEEYYRSQQAVIRPLFVVTSPSSPDETETVFTNKFNGPSPDTIDFSSLQVKNVRLIPDSSDEHDRNVTDSISEQIDKCDADIDDRYFHCFAPNDQKNCIYRRKCPVMVIVEEVLDDGSLHHDKLRFRLIVFRKSEDGVKHVVRPSGWAAVGFSSDVRMGDDLVISCQTYGDEHKVLVTWNRRRNNVYNKDFNQDLIDPVAKVISLRTKNSDKFMCEWTMNSSVTVDISAIPGKLQTDEEGNNITKVEIDLKKTTYLLLASGTSVYSDYRMGYHTFREALREKLELQEGPHHGGARSGLLFSLYFRLLISLLLSLSYVL